MISGSDPLISVFWDVSEGYVALPLLDGTSH